MTEDIIHEALLKASAEGPKLRSDANIPGWLKQIARRTALDKLKKFQRNRQMLNTFDAILDSSVLAEISVDSEVESKIKNELLYEAIKELKAEYRTVIMMHYLEGKTYKEICCELDMTEAVLAQRLTRARKKLLKQFLRKWADVDE